MPPFLIAVQPTLYDGVLHAPGTTFETQSAEHARVLKAIGRAVDAPLEPLPVPDPVDMPERKRRKRSDTPEAE